MNKKLLLIQLNEINFEIVDRYLLSSKSSEFSSLKYIRNVYKHFDTYAEDEYKNLEPWIQWVSIYLGKKYNEHKIFRLGDSVNFHDQKQIFEIIEEKGFRVGAISPMSAVNRLKKPSYFIPDPWTNTNSDSSKFSKKLTSMLRQTVNENSLGKISFKSILTIVEIVIRTLNLSKTFFLVKLVFSSFFNSWKKALVLDYLIHLVHLYMLKKKPSNFSSIFFNAGAHIQHHYLHNSIHVKNISVNPSWYIKPLVDPIEQMLKVYDKIISDYINLSKNNYQLIISTGLRQVPYPKPKFYYRLKNHSSFLKKIGISFTRVLPRMTRDFEIIFQNNEDRDFAINKLKKLKSNKENLEIFKEIEVRDESLFVTLTYPNEINKNTFIKDDCNINLNFFDEVAFVAIKNGMHDSKGYVFYSSNYDFKILNKPVHVSTLNRMILSYFD